MNSSKLIHVYCWKPEPGLQWRCHEGVSGICVDAASKQEAIDHFNQIWNFRSPVQWIYEAPKRPKRPDTAPQQENLLEVDTAFHRSLVRRFHPDLIGKKTFSADQVVAAINELWLATRAKS